MNVTTSKPKERGRTPLDRRTLVRTLGTVGLATLVAAVVAPTVGSTPVRLDRALFGDPQGADHLVLVYARLPRIWAALLAGSGLASAGLALQSLLRNPLAEPYTLGVSGGGAFAAALVVVLGLDSLLPSGLTVPAAALGGSILTMALVARLARGNGRGLSPSVLLLTGISISVFCGAGILAALHVSEPLTWTRVQRWLMGGLDVAGYQLLVITTPIVLGATAVVFARARAMNALALGDDAAAALGVDVDRTRRLLFLAASVATGAVVSVCGPIGFVGLIVPHALRRIVGPDHRVLAPSAALAGGFFLLLCDTATRLVFPVSEPPVGLLTALIGGPVLVLLLLRAPRLWGGGRL